MITAKLLVTAFTNCMITVVSTLQTVIMQFVNA
jgi:hypothetical protein